MTLKESTQNRHLYSQHYKKTGIKSSQPLLTLHNNKPLQTGAAKRHMNPNHLNHQWLPYFTTKNSRLKYYTQHPTSILKTIHTPHTLNTIINNLHQTPPPDDTIIQQWQHQHNEWKQAGKTNPHTATPQQLQANALTTAPTVESFTDAYASMKAEHYQRQDNTT